MHTIPRRLAAVLVGLLLAVGLAGPAPAGATTDRPAIDPIYEIPANTTVWKTFGYCTYGVNIGNFGSTAYAQLAAGAACGNSSGVNMYSDDGSGGDWLGSGCDLGWARGYHVGPTHCTWDPSGGGNGTLQRDWAGRVFVQAKIQVCSGNGTTCRTERYEIQ